MSKSVKRPGLSRQNAVTIFLWSVTACSIILCSALQTGYFNGARAFKDRLRNSGRTIVNQRGMSELPHWADVAVAGAGDAPVPINVRRVVRQPNTPVSAALNHFQSRFPGSDTTTASHTEPSFLRGFVRGGIAAASLGAALCVGVGGLQLAAAGGAAASIIAGMKAGMGPAKKATIVETVPEPEPDLDVAWKKFRTEFAEQPNHWVLTVPSHASMPSENLPSVVSHGQSNIDQPRHVQLSENSSSASPAPAGRGAQVRSPKQPHANRRNARESTYQSVISMGTSSGKVAGKALGAGMGGTFGAIAGLVAAPFTLGLSLPACTGEGIRAGWQAGSIFGGVAGTVFGHAAKEGLHRTGIFRKAPNDSVQSTRV